MSEFTEYLHEVFEPFGPIQIKPMFGGYGIYHQGLMFALVADDALYFKADPLSREKFELAGSVPFEYTREGRTMTMSYYSAPEEIFDDPDAARRWAERAYEAALRRARLSSGQCSSRS